MAPLLRQQLRKQLAMPTTTIAICLLGLAGGVLAALMIAGFRFAIEYGAHLIGNDTYWQEPLPTTLRFIIPIAAALLIYGIFRLSGSRYVRMGIPYVIHRMKQHYGMLPWRSTVNQFFWWNYCPDCRVQCRPRRSRGSFRSGRIDLARLPCRCP